MKPLLIGELPQELLVRPSALVTFTGLDVANNPVHKAIWESFTVNRRPDRAPLEFKLLSETHQFPNCKQKRTSYEWYVPKGLLKTNWLNKHLNEVPALHVLYVDLDWDHPQWNDVMQQCAQRVQALRGRLLGRNSLVALVLIQTNISLPPGEDVLAAEHAATLCSACDLTPKSLFMLPHSDHLLGYVTRLEMAFNELTKSYYNHEARAIKVHQDFLSKTTHQLLFVRHQFKMGFLNELKQDSISALKHFKQAYSNLMEVRVSDTNLLEIKTVAGFINYKICKLSFLNTPLEAISQFRKHIDTFKLKEGGKELLFEHSAWISKQFEHFGDLFDDAIKQGLAAIQTQHPGFYYQQAAHHATMRKEMCHKICSKVVDYPVNDPIVNEDSMEFYGQRPWRPGNQNLEPPDPQKEKDGTQALQHREITSVNHSKVIIPLLNNAVNQFKKYRCPRMKRHLMVLMGEEYYHNQEYNRALVLLSKVSWDYRSEKWWQLLTSIHRTAMKCAYLSANIQEYISLALEMIGNHVEFSTEEKTRIQRNMLQVIQKKMPEPEPGCFEKSVEKAKGAWEQVIKAEPQFLTIELNSVMAFVECKARFSQETFYADQIVELSVHCRIISPLPVEFEKLSVLFSNKVYNDECVLNGGKGLNGGCSLLHLPPMQTKTFKFSFIPQENDVEQIVQITSVMMQLGNEPGHSAVLYWSDGGGANIAPTAHFSGFSSQDELADFSLIRILPFTRIRPREPKISVWVHHDAPALQNEFYPVKVVIKNDEVAPIKNVKLHFKLCNESVQIHQNTHFSIDEPKYMGTVVSTIEPISIKDLQQDEIFEKTLFVRFFSKDTRDFEVQVTYKVEVDVGKWPTCQCAKNEAFSIQTVDPFEISIQTLDYKFCEMKFASSEEPFVLISDVMCISPWPLTIETSHLGLSGHVNAHNGTVTSQLTNTKLRTDDVASECICVVAPCANPSPVPLGDYTLQWRRESADSKIPFVQTTVTMPSVVVKPAKLYIETMIPASGMVRTTLPASYTIHNRTDSVLELEIVMDSSEAFMFSGHKQNTFRMLPRDKEKLDFNFYPLLCGNIMLPQMRIKLNPSSESPLNFDQELEKMVPSHVFIMPQGKTRDKIAEHQAILLS